MTYKENIKTPLSQEALKDVVREALKPFPAAKRVLLIHPDYSRHDFSDVITPIAYHILEEQGLQQLDTLNAGGTHRPMTEAEILLKLGLNWKDFPLINQTFNHQFDDPEQLIQVGDIPAEFVSEKTNGSLDQPLSITANKLITDDYDLIIAISGTVPHECVGYSGGLKIFFPGLSGPEVIGLLHWASVLIGIPKIIGELDTPARDVVIEGAKYCFKAAGNTPILSLNMLYAEENHILNAHGLYSGLGVQGFIEAHKKAASASSKIHINYLDQPLKQAVQQIPSMYDEVWTAGKGSYKLQRPGVMAKGGEIILYAPHIDCFHSNQTLDKAIRKIGYHCREKVLEFVSQYPDFDRNVASHVINVRGDGTYIDGIENFDFDVTLATAIPEEDCRAVGLGYRDPASIKKEDFSGSGQLWIEEGGKWLYSKKTA